MYCRLRWVAYVRVVVMGQVMNLASHSSASALSRLRRSMHSNSMPPCEPENLQDPALRAEASLTFRKVAT